MAVRSKSSPVPSALLARGTGPVWRGKTRWTNQGDGDNERFFQEQEPLSRSRSLLLASQSLP
jgi:hypothetical protein